MSVAWTPRVAALSLSSLLLWASPACAQGVAGEAVAPRVEAPALMVVGFTTAVKLEAWQDARLGFGLSAALADTLYGSGRFRLLEEKAEVRQRMRDLGARLWAEPGRQTELHADALAVLEANESRPRWIASGRVVRFGTSTTRASLGPLQQAQRGFTVQVEVTLEDLATGRTVRASAEGHAARTATSAFFSVRDDRVLFDATGVGKATLDALHGAVAELLSRSVP
jgi:hypothetical protein